MHLKRPSQHSRELSRNALGTHSPFSSVGKLETPTQPSLLSRQTSLPLKIWLVGHLNSNQQLGTHVFVLDSKNNELARIRDRLQTTAGECGKVQSRHDAAASSFASDIASVSRVLEELKLVECSDLSAFIQTMALKPHSSLCDSFNACFSFICHHVCCRVNLLEMPDCPCQSLIQVRSTATNPPLCFTFASILSHTLMVCTRDATVPPLVPMFQKVIIATSSCVQTNSHNVQIGVEFSCDKKRENVRQLLKSLLDQLHSASAEDARTFKTSFAACLADQQAQEAVVTRLTDESATYVSLICRK